MVAEHRQITVMFCDLVGSTKLSVRLDPEDYRDVLRTYQETSAEAIENFDGYIAQHLGDGILVYFGYPSSFEDNATRAVLAGTNIIEAIKKVRIDIQDEESIKLEVKIGIHTGDVIIDEIANLNKTEYLALGEAPNVASRLKDLASSNQLIISEETFNLLNRRFDCSSLGFQTLKGVADPVGAYRVSGQRISVEEKFLRPLEGRKQEHELLIDGWERVNEGEGQVVVITGEAGIGKSRLIQALKEDVTTEGTIIIECFCSPYFQNSFLYPVCDYLKRFLFKIENKNIDKYSQLSKILGKYGLSEEVIMLFANFLNISDEGGTEFLPDLSPQKVRQKIFEELIKWVLEESENNPVLFIFEDLHWSDPSTQEFLNLFIQNVPKSKIFLLLTYRTGFKPSWDTRSYITQIVLNRLIRKHSHKIIENILGITEVQESIIIQIVNRSDGNPLFLEEMTKIIMSEISNGDIAETTSLIPSTLNDLLMAKLDALKEEKKIAKIASVLGREFSFDLISEVSSESEDELIGLLNNLVDSEILYVKGIHPDSKYFFKHHLIHDAAYNSLLKSEKKSFHKKAATALESKFSDLVGLHPEILAYHLTQAGIYEKAVRFWLKSGKHAIEKSAHTEAISHLEKARELLSRTKIGTSEKDELELEILTTFGAPLRVLKGYGSEEVESVYARARELTEKAGSSPKMFPVLRVLCGFYIANAKFDTALQLAGAIENIAKKSKDSSQIIQSNYLLSAIYTSTGKLSKGLSYGKKGFSVYDRKLHGPHTLLYGLDPGVSCLFWVSWSLYLLGYPDKALHNMQKALKLAEDLNHPHSISVALVLNSSAYYFRGEAEQTKEFAEKALILLDEQGSVWFHGMARILNGWSLFELEGVEEAIEEIQNGTEAWQKTGGAIFTTLWYSILASAKAKNGQLKESTEILNNAVSIAEKNGEIFFLPELHRQIGENNQEDPENAEKHFRKAVEISKKQKAKSLELRASLSLARLLAGQGKKEEAYKTLKNPYKFFKEGFDTKDLKESGEFLEKLG